MTNRKELARKNNSENQRVRIYCKMQDEKIIAIIKLLFIKWKKQRILATFIFGVPIKEFFSLKATDILSYMSINMLNYI